MYFFFFFFFSSRRRHTRYIGDWSSDVCSSDLVPVGQQRDDGSGLHPLLEHVEDRPVAAVGRDDLHAERPAEDRKSTRLNSSHRCISYAVFCLKKKKTNADTRSIAQHYMSVGTR